MKKFLYLAIIGVFQNQALFAQTKTEVEKKDPPKALIVKVNKDTGETTTFEVEQTSENLKDVKVLEKFVANLENNAVAVPVRKSARAEIGEGEATPACGIWGYNRPYYYVGSYYWNFPSYNYSYYNYNYNYYTYNHVSWGNYYYYNYQPAYYCRPHTHCWYY